MQTYGILPGPTLMTDQPDLVWTLLASLLIGNTLLLVINLPLAPLWAKLLRIPRPQLYAGILFFASLGAYSVNQDPFDLALLLVFGAVGLRDPALRHPGAAADPRRHPRAADGGQDARGARPLRRRRSAGCSTRALAIFVYVLIVLAIVLPIVLGRLRRSRSAPSCTDLDDEEARPMTVVVGYIPNQYGEAALSRRGIEEAAAARHRPGRRQRHQRRRAGRQALRRRGWAGRARGAARRARRRPTRCARRSAPTSPTRSCGSPARSTPSRGRDRHAAPHAGRQADHGQRRPAGAAGRPLPGDRRQARRGLRLASICLRAASSAPGCSASSAWAVRELVSAGGVDRGVGKSSVGAAGSSTGSSTDGLRSDSADGSRWRWLSFWALARHGSSGLNSPSRVRGPPSPGGQPAPSRRGQDGCPFGQPQYPAPLEADRTADRRSLVLGHLQT